MTITIWLCLLFPASFNPAALLGLWENPMSIILAHTRAQMSTLKWSIKQPCVCVCVFVCVYRLCLAHCWAVNRRWLWQEVGITILPMSLVFIFCLFCQRWLLQTHPSQILLYTSIYTNTHTHTAAIHIQVYACDQLYTCKCFVERRDVTSVYSLKKETKFDSGCTICDRATYHVRCTFSTCSGFVCVFGSVSVFLCERSRPTGVWLGLSHAETVWICSPAHSRLCIHVPHQIKASFRQRQ